MKEGIAIYANGRTETLNLVTIDTGINTNDIQRVIGGYIEAVPNSHGMTIFANEDGLHMNLPYNRNASLLCERLIVGNVVCLGPPNSAGDTTGLTDEQIALIERL